jgi:hypothetical protein
MIDMRHKPYFLPQVHMPYDIVLQKLRDEDVGYDFIEADPNELKAMQGITFSDDVGKVKPSDDKPIWVGDDMSILDGHHRWVRALLDNTPVKAVKIKMNPKDACRLLNRLQDIYEYEQALNVEEVVAQDQINFDNDQNAGISSEEFLKVMEETNEEISGEDALNPQKLIGYRKQPINDKSVVGNFFLLSPQKGYDKYEIEFENLLDTNALGVAYMDGQQPIDILSKIWFPNVNFEVMAESQETPSINIKNKAIAEKAKKMGYDGIKHGDILLQGL